MKIALINGSPKLKSSASGCLLADLRFFLDQKHEITEYHFAKPQISIDQLKGMIESDVLIFAFPLYIDAIPSHLLNCLVQLEKPLRELKKNITVYAIINCGFFEDSAPNSVEIEKDSSK